MLIYSVETNYSTENVETWLNLHLAVMKAQYDWHIKHMPLVATVKIYQFQMTNN